MEGLKNAEMRCMKCVQAKNSKKVKKTRIVQIQTNKGWKEIEASLLCYSNCPK